MRQQGEAEHASLLVLPKQCPLPLPDSVKGASMGGTKVVEPGNKLTPRRRCSVEYEGIIGVGAATLTTLSHLPRLKKCWQTGRTTTFRCEPS